MKLITLNTWGGRLFAPLAKFITSHSKDTDIFCFQEVYDTSSDEIYTRTKRSHPVYRKNRMTNAHAARADGLSQIRKRLPNHKLLYNSSQDNTDFHGPVDFDLRFGLAMFVKKNLEVLEHGDVFVHQDKNVLKDTDHSTMGSPRGLTPRGRNIQWTKIRHNKKIFNICNFHGIWSSEGKNDSPERFEQSKKINDFLNTLGGEIILCGDFNLLPETESVGIIEENMINLVKQFDVKSTRSKFYTKAEKFADYIFVTKGTWVKDFRVLKREISDHLPLYLEFS